MEQQKKLDYDSDIIICEDIPETISLSTSSETINKPKKKKHKRKPKKDVNFNNNMETLLITQKFKVKTKFKCIININTVPVCEKEERSGSIVRSHTEKSGSIVRSHTEKSGSIVRSHTEKSGSIVRSHTNVCNKEAYYHRIVPMCLREQCSCDSASCRRSTISRDNKYMHPKVGSLSPVSSLPLTEAFWCNNISYEDISNGSFSITSDEELDTLIKRTRQREKQIDISHTARKFNTSTPISKDENMASPFSIDTEKTIHSDNTMILNTLPTEAYSPMSFEIIKEDNMEIDDSLNMNDIDVPYSPTMTPDLIKIENSDYSPADKTSHDDDIPYSPTYTPESIEVVIMDDIENSAIDMNQPYSPTFTPDIIQMEKLDNGNIEHGNEPYSPSMTLEIKMENPNNFTDIANENATLNVRYSPRSPTVAPEYHNFSITQTDNWNDFTVPYSATASGIIKQESVDDEFTIIKNTITPKFAMLTPDLKKKENEYHRSHFNETDYNMNNTNYNKSEKDDYQAGMHDQFNQNETIKKNNVYMKTEDVKVEIVN